MTTRTLLLTLVLTACGGAAGPSTAVTGAGPAAGGEGADEGADEGAGTSADAHIAAVLEAADRTPEDRALDAQRRPLEVFSFFGIEEGMRVADLFAGGGYSTEILARVVGPSGHVIAQNNAFVLERFARAPLEARLARLAMPSIAPVQAELDAPLPADTHDLDAVIFILSYHDSAWMGTDRAAMNRAVFAALRPGGIYGIVDHSAAEGHGVDDAQTFHRIEERVVIEEVLAAGFVLDGSSDVLRNPEDTRDWNDSPSAAGERRGQSDRFVLRFVRP